MHEEEGVACPSRAPRAAGDMGVQELGLGALPPLQPCSRRALQLGQVELMWANPAEVITQSPPFQKGVVICTHTCHNLFELQCCQ